MTHRLPSTASTSDETSRQGPGQAGTWGITRTSTKLPDLLPQCGVLHLQRHDRTQFRSVSGLTPRSAATGLVVAPGRDSYSATASTLGSGG